MKKEKKEKLLKKYLNKKEKQKKRDELFMELKKYENEVSINLTNAVPNKRKAKKDKYKNITIKINPDFNSESLKITPTKCNENEPAIKNNSNYENCYYVDITGDNKKKQKISAKTNEGIDDAYINLVKPKVMRNKKIESCRMKLPIYYEEEEIVTKMKQFDVSIIQGATGCGKSTQIPQFVYENGLCFGKKVLITQPRRIAAIGISKRINYELNEDVCGYKIRYESTVTEKTRIKIVTEGILLNEIKSDFLLTDYSMIILDEVHEKTADMEIIIALLNKIRKERERSGNQLKLILMSANIGFDDYENLFDCKAGKINVESNNYGVKIFYEKETAIDATKAAYFKIIEILNNKKYPDITILEYIGILVFVPGTEQIYALIKMLRDLKLDVVVIPLHSSLSISKQNKIYEKCNKTKIIISTNIAETSLTIPDINIVIDTGLAKYKQHKDANVYNYAINFISKSSATQRAGRAGRTSDGLCFRLYSSKMFEKFRLTEKPEISNIRLETHILMLKAIGVNSIRNLGCVSSIPVKHIELGYQLLRNYGAINCDGEITELGAKMACLPLDARYALMVLTKSKHIKYLLLSASILTYNFEVCKNTNAYDYYNNCKSDIIVKLRVIIDFFYQDNKEIFAKEIGVNMNTISEIIKMYYHLCNTTKIDKEFVQTMDFDIERDLQQIFCIIFCDNLAVLYDGYYLYNGQKVFLSNNSVDICSKRVVFDHIIEGNNKMYLKNVTYAEIFIK